MDGEAQPEQGCENENAQRPVGEPVELLFKTVDEILHAINLGCSAALGKGTAAFLQERRIRCRPPAQMTVIVVPRA